MDEVRYIHLHLLIVIRNVRKKGTFANEIQVSVQFPGRDKIYQRTGGGSDDTQGPTTDSGGGDTQDSNTYKPQCQCADGGQSSLVLLTSRTAANPGRKFWRCSGCDFFMWQS